MCKGATEHEAQVRLKTYWKRAGLQPHFSLPARVFAKTGQSAKGDWGVFNDSVAAFLAGALAAAGTRRSFVTLSEDRAS